MGTRTPITHHLSLLPQGAGRESWPRRACSRAAHLAGGRWAAQYRGAAGRPAAGCPAPAGHTKGCEHHPERQPTLLRAPQGLQRGEVPGWCQPWRISWLGPAPHASWRSNPTAPTRAAPPHTFWLRVRSRAVEYPAASTTRAALLRPSEATEKLIELFRYLFGVVMPRFPPHKDSKQQEEFPLCRAHTAAFTETCSGAGSAGPWCMAAGIRPQESSQGLCHCCQTLPTFNKTHLTQFPALGKETKGRGGNLVATVIRGSWTT